MDLDASGSGRDPAGPGGQDGADPADGGVVRRLARRTTGTLIVIAILVAILAAVVWHVVGDGAAGDSSIAAAILVVLGLIPIVVLVRRVSLWHRAGEVVARLSADVGEASVADRGWIAAACGEPVRVHRANARFRRVDRLPPHYLPLRTASGALRTGRPVLVHARRDGVTPQAGDRLELLALSQSRRGPFLVRRRDDGVIFVADGWLLSAA